MQRTITCVRKDDPARECVSCVYRELNQTGMKGSPLHPTLTKHGHCKTATAMVFKPISNTDRSNSGID